MYTGSPVTCLFFSRNVSPACSGWYEAILLYCLISFWCFKIQMLNHQCFVYPPDLLWSGKQRERTGLLVGEEPIKMEDGVGCL